MPDTSSPVTAIPGNIRAELRRAGITEEKAAEAIELSRSTWSRWMAEPDYWRMRYLTRLAELLDVPLSRLTDQPPR
jgi:transcriptional regulator with XRE-family HTH domain